MINIVIIGAGQIGSRHLQGLALSKYPIEVHVIDPSDEALRFAEQRWNEVQSTGGEKKILYARDYSALPSQIDVGIVATSSVERRKVTEELLSRSNVRYLILEKVLFPALGDYDAMGDLFRQIEVKVFVDCARREFPFYQDLKRKFAVDSKINFLVTGNNFGLACNGIHFLDLFAYITGSSSLTVSAQGLDKKIHESKRTGYMEVTGTLVGFDSRGNAFAIGSYDDTPSPVRIMISSSGRYYIIEEGTECRVSYAEAASGWQTMNTTFPVLYISSLAGKIIDRLIDTGSCNLTGYNESAEIHKPFISAIKGHMEKCLDKKLIICPIT